MIYSSNLYLCPTKTNLFNKMKKKTLIKLSITAVILLALGFWINSRWNAWFRNPPEPSYTSLSSPGRVLLTFGTEDELSRNISWECDSVVLPSFVELVDSQAEDTLQIQAQGETFRSRNGKAAYYVARLRSLLPDRSYAYRVCSGGKYSPWYNFKTQNQVTRNDYSFLFVGDVQDSINGKSNSFLKKALQKHPETEFLVFGGDLTERPIDAYWGETFRGLDSIGQHYPVITVTGNHDYLKYPIRKLERRFSLIFSYFLDSMIGENQVYTLKYNDIQLFCLDSNREFFYLWTQRQWLKEQLEKSQARWKIVVLHHPIHSIKGKYNNLIQRTLFGSVIEEFGVDMALQGHEHAYGRMTNHTQTGIPTTPLYTVSHCSPKTYRIYFGERFDKFGIAGKYYQQIRVHGDTLTMNAYDALTGELYDALDIIKNENGTTLTDNGKHIPENLYFKPNPHDKNDQKYQELINAYKERKGIN